MENTHEIRPNQMDTTVFTFHPLLLHNTRLIYVSPR